MTWPVRMFCIDDYLQPGEAFHVAHKELDRRPPPALHYHDYFELMLVEHGRTVHWINGARETLGAGDLVFIRPADAHGFMADSDRGCRILNVMFGADSAAFLLGRYAEAFAGRFFWRRAAAPLTLRLTGALFDRAVDMTLSLRGMARSRLRIETYLLSMMTTALDGHTNIDPSAPQWLIDACEAARRPEVFRKGAAGFVEAAGRGREHVCRQARRHLGATPTQYVNRIRIRHAAKLLAGSSMRLDQIAGECGVTNQSHFHKLFRDAYGTTPSAYRRRRRRDPLQDG